MKRTIRIALPLLLAAAVVAASGCGGSDSSVPSGSVAVVDGTPITKDDLDALIARAKKSYVSQKRAFPKAGTSDYQSLQSQAVAFLVQRAEYAKEADKRKLAVTDEEIQARVNKVKKQYFAGSQKKLDAQLKAQGYTPEGFRADIEAQLISEKLYNQLTKSVKVTDAEVKKYYEDNKSQYEVAESRDVRHILVKQKALADKIYAQVKAGGDFAALAKKYSTGPRLEGQGRQAHDHEGPDRPRLRHDCVPARDEPGLQAGQDAIRIPRDPGHVAGQAGQDDPVQGGQGADREHARGAEEEHGRPELGRVDDEGVRQEGLLRERLRATGGRDDRRRADDDRIAHGAR